MALSKPLFTDVHSGLGYDPATHKWTSTQPTGARPPLQWTVPPEWHIPQASSDLSTLSYPSSPGSSASSGSSPSSRASSPVSSTAPSAAKTAKKPSVSRRRAKDPNHIPRPRNSFIIFRSVVCTHVKDVESDHRMISRIVAKMWQNAPNELKNVYKKLADIEKQQHMQFYPKYRFSPQQRATPPKKRKVKRNGESDRQRCIRVAELLLEGKGGDDLKAEVSKFDESVQEQARQNSSENFSTGVFDSKAWNSPPPPPSTESNEDPFRSPLLPPATPAPLFTSSITVSTPSEPLSPLDLLPTNETQAPTLGVVPLPDVQGDVYLSQAADYTFLQATDASATHFGAMLAHEQGSLALSGMYTPKTATFMLAAHNDDYTFQSEPFVHDIAVPLDPALHTFSFPAAQMQASFQPQLAYENYTLVDQPQSQCQSQSQTQTQMQMQMPRSEGWLFPPGEALTTFQPFAAVAPGQSWSYAPESGLDVSSHAQNLSAHAWMQ